MSNIYGRLKTSDMATFLSRRRVTTLKPEIRVDPGLPEGEYLFRLVMVASNNKMSKPVFKRVKIGPQRGIPGRGSMQPGNTPRRAVAAATINTLTDADSATTKANAKKRISSKSTARATTKKSAVKKAAVKKVVVKKPAVKMEAVKKRATGKRTAVRKSVAKAKQDRKQ